MKEDDDDDDDDDIENMETRLRTVITRTIFCAFI